MFFLFDLLSGLLGLVLIFLIVGVITGNLFFVVKQQHAVIIERLGKFHRIVPAASTPRSRLSTARPPRCRFAP